MLLKKSMIQDRCNQVIYITDVLDAVTLYTSLLPAENRLGDQR